MASGVPRIVVFSNKYSSMYISPPQLLFIGREEAVDSKGLQLLMASNRFSQSIISWEGTESVGKCLGNICYAM